jgi:DNA polymerase-3 subunit delta
LKINLNQLSSHLQNKLATCYFVTGDEHLLVDEALDAIRAVARDRGFTSRDLHVATTGFDWSSLRQAGANLSLFAEKRIVELRVPTGKPGRTGSQAIADFIDNCDDDLLFIVVAPKLERNNQSAKWVKALDAAGVMVTVWPIDRRELPRWIAGRMRAAGLQPDGDAVTLIADRVEGNLLAADQEVEKLRLILGEGKVTADDVGDAVANSSRFDVFKLVDAALGGDAQRALRILSGLRAEGVEPVIVVWALARELRTLAALTETVAGGGNLASGMKKQKVWTNRQGLVRGCVGRHKHGDFHRLLRTASEADQAAKGQSPGDPWQISTDIVMGLSRS